MNIEDLQQKLYFNILTYDVVRLLVSQICIEKHLQRHLADHITTDIEVASRHRLRSANGHRLIVPRCRLRTRAAFPMFSSRWSDGLEQTHCQMSSEIRRVVLTVSNSRKTTLNFLVV